MTNDHRLVNRSSKSRQFYLKGGQRLTRDRRSAEDPAEDPGTVVEVSEVAEVECKGEWPHMGNKLLQCAEQMAWREHSMVRTESPEVDRTEEVSVGDATLSEAGSSSEGSVSIHVGIRDVRTLGTWMPMVSTWTCEEPYRRMTGAEPKDVTMPAMVCLIRRGRESVYE